jgi:CheY-like chemotaxis protein
VEDDEFLRMTVPLRIFAPLGIAYDSAANGAIAVEMVTAEGAPRYDLVLMDNQVRDVRARALLHRWWLLAGAWGQGCWVRGCSCLSWW